MKYEQEIMRWRAEKEDEWRRENGWLALAGLFWLGEGLNVVGSGEGCDVMLPMGVERLGEIEVASLTEIGDRDRGRFANREILWRGDEGAEGVLVDGEAVREAVLRPDVGGEPTMVTVGELTFMVIQRGESYAVRLWDNGRPERRDFDGRRWFEVDEGWRARGRYERFVEPELVMVARSQGADAELPIAGRVVFELAGEQVSLLAQEWPVGTLFLIFKDGTSGKETYGAGRFLYAAVEEDGTVMVDFNRAYSPPCAVTVYATCPFPPRENVLPVAVRAGEQYSRKGLEESVRF